MALYVVWVCILALCSLALGRSLERNPPPATPCKGDGCPGIPLYLGPRWGLRVIHPVEKEPGNSHQDEEEQQAHVRDEPQFLGKNSPPITYFTFPTTTTSPPPNVEKHTYGHPTNDTGPKANHEINLATDNVEMQLSKLLRTPDPDEGVEEFDLLQDPKTTSIYDKESESEENFIDEFLRRVNKLRKPVPDDGSFSIDFGQPEDDTEDVVRILPNFPTLGLLDWSGYQLTGEEVKKALYLLSPYAREQLRSLDLSNNLIIDLEPLTFPPQLENTLEQLSLNGNPLQYLSSSSRFELSRLQQLKVLSLRRTSLRSFPPLLLRSLRTLHLEDNLLTEVPDTLPSIPSLTELDLSGNRISGITEPIDLPNLRILTLNNNSISYIDKEAFSNCYNLERVYLQNNLLTSAPLEMFESPTVFYLKNNPLDRSLQRMLGHEGAIRKPFCASCPGLPSWVYSFTLNSSLLLIALLVLLLAVLAVRSRLTRLPPYMVLDEKCPK